MMINRLKYTLLSVSVSSFLSAQLTRIEPITVPVNYYQTVHLIFPATIKYYNSVGKYVSIDSPQEVPFVLRIKANGVGFSETNVSVATADGKFYDFSVSYNENLLLTNLFLKDASWKVPESIGIGTKRQTHLLFPQPIVYVDIGDPIIYSQLAGNTRNIISIQAVADIFPVKETNITVITADREFYTYNISYSDSPASSYYVTPRIEKEREQVILLENEFTDGDRQEIRNKIASMKRRIYSLGENKEGILFSVANIFIHENLILFRCEVKNTSSIPYHAEYMKFNIVDKKKQKLTASQELEQIPIFWEGYKASIKPGDVNVFSIGFETFTIPDDKFLRIELNEKNGGRHVRFDMQNKDIVTGETF
jgi:conjugative transposon TraN protein